MNNSGIDDFKHKYRIQVSLSLFKFKLCQLFDFLYIYFFYIWGINKHLLVMWVIIFVNFLFMITFFLFFVKRWVVWRWFFLDRDPVYFVSCLDGSINYSRVFIARSSKALGTIKLTANYHLNHLSNRCVDLGF